MKNKGYFGYIINGNDLLKSKLTSSVKAMFN